jgi:hypothetical protein
MSDATHAQPQGDSGQPQAAQQTGTPEGFDTRTEAAVAAALEKILPKMLNPAITNHTKRLEERLLQRFQPAQDATEAATTAPVKSSDQMAAMQKALETMQTQLRAADEAKRTAERESHLRTVVSGLGVTDPEAVVRILRPDLKVGEDNRYYRDDATVGMVAVEDFAKAYVSQNKWLLQSANRGGGGGTASASPTQQGGDTMSQAEYTAKLASFGNDSNARQAFVMQALAGRINIKG